MAVLLSATLGLCRAGGAVDGNVRRVTSRATGTATGSADPERGATVTMTNRLTFEPGTVRVSVGDTVRWRNTSDLVHTVTADPARAAKEGSVRLPSGAEPFHSGPLSPGTAFSRGFQVVGTYRYFCVPHEAAGMTGTVVVSERFER